MKRKVVVQETETTVYDELLAQDEYVTVMCLNYFYHGELVGVNGDSIVLNDAKIVYETGKFSEKGFKDAQSLCATETYIKKDCIESIHILPNKN